MVDNPYLAPGTTELSGGLRPPLALVICCGLACVVFAFVSISSGTPCVWAPFPLPSVIPAILFYPLILPIPFGFFYLNSRSLFHSAEPATESTPPLPKFRVVAIVLNALWIANGWSYGVSYQGTQHVVVVSVINIVFTAMIALLWCATRRQDAHYSRLASSTVFSIWFFWYAFPWLGELP